MKPSSIFSFKKIEHAEHSESEDDVHRRYLSLLRQTSELKNLLAGGTTFESENNLAIRNKRNILNKTIENIQSACNSNQYDYNATVDELFKNLQKDCVSKLDSAALMLQDNIGKFVVLVAELAKSHSRPSWFGGLDKSFYIKLLLNSKKCSEYLIQNEQNYMPVSYFKPTVEKHTLLIVRAKELFLNTLFDNSKFDKLKEAKLSNEIEQFRLDINREIANIKKFNPSWINAVNDLKSTMDIGMSKFTPVERVVFLLVNQSLPNVVNDSLLNYLTSLSVSFTTKQHIRTLEYDVHDNKLVIITIYFHVEMFDSFPEHLDYENTETATIICKCLVELNQDQVVNEDYLLYKDIKMLAVDLYEGRVFPNSNLSIASLTQMSDIG